MATETSTAHAGKRRINQAPGPSAETDDEVGAESKHSAGGPPAGTVERQQTNQHG